MALGEYVKGLEALSDLRLDPKLPVVIRCDGRAFSKFTRGFRRPMDERLATAMVRTTEDLVLHFHAPLGYTQSDEISLVLPATPPEKRPGGATHMFDGRVQKLCSVAAGLASVRFSYHLGRLCAGTDMQDRAEGMTAHFDARAFSAPDPGAAAKCVWWRHATDCFRNGVQAAAMAHFGKSMLYGKKTRELVSMLEREGVPLGSLPPHLLYGTFVKKELYEGETPAGEPVGRRRPRCWSGRLAGTHAEKTAWVFEKYWTAEAPVGADGHCSDPEGEP